MVKVRTEEYHNGLAAGRKHMGGKIWMKERKKEEQRRLSEEINEGRE